MNNLNKLVTNYPVTLTPEEVKNLSMTLSAVKTASGTGGKTYNGDNTYIGVDNTNNTIRFLNDAINKLESVSSKLNTSAFSDVSGDFLTEHQSLANYYQKTETSGVSELDTAFGSKQDNLTQEQLSAISSVSSIKGTVLAGDANIRTTSAEDGNNIKWTIELTAQPVVTDTTLSGYDGIVATKDSIVNSQWNIGIAQAYKEQIEAVSSKLTETVANTLYAPISVTGDVDTLKTSSGDWDKVSAKLDTSAFSSVSGNFITASQPFTANLGAESKITVFAYSNLEVNQHSNVIFTQNSQFSAINNNLLQGEGNSYNAGGGASFIQGQYNTGAYCSMAQGLHNNVGNCSQAFGIGNVITNTGMAIGTYNKTSSDVSFVIGNGTDSNRSDLFIIKHDGTVSSTGDFIVDGKSLSSVYNTISANSGEWLKESDLNYYVTSGDITTQDTDYVMTTNGWKVLTLPGGGMTQVIHDTTLTGQGNANDNKLGVAWSALSGNTINSAKSATYAEQYWDAEAGDYFTISGQIDLLYDYVDNKVAKPDTTQTVLNNNYLIYSTLTGEGTTTGWMPLSANYYSKRESDDRYVTTANVGSGLYYSGSSPKLGVKLGTDLAFNTTTSAIQINTDGTAYGTHAFVEGTNTTASGNGTHAEGADAGAFGQGAHAGGYGTHTTGVGNFIHGTFLNFASPDGTAVSNTPVFVGGTLNATTAQNYNDHGGYLQIMGNGAYTGGGKGNNSDAYILYRDGTVSAKQFQNADGTETINGTIYNFSGVDNIEILPNAATANTANFPNDNVLRFILES